MAPEATTTTTSPWAGRVMSARAPSGVSAMLRPVSGGYWVTGRPGAARSTDANPRSPTANAVSPLLDSATSVGAKPRATGNPSGTGATRLPGGRTVKSTGLLTAGPAATTTTGPVTAPAGTLTTIDDGVTFV